MLDDVQGSHSGSIDAVVKALMFYQIATISARIHRANIGPTSH